MKSGRNRWFVDSPLEGNGFELPVRGRGQSGVGPFGWVVLCDRVRSGRGASGTARYQRRGWAILAAGLGAGRAGDGFPDATEAAQAKIFTSEMAIKVTNDALQLFGAAGYSRNRPLERMVRDARIFTIGAARRRSCARSWR